MHSLHSCPSYFQPKASKKQGRLCTVYIGQTKEASLSPIPSKLLRHFDMTIEAAECGEISSRYGVVPHEYESVVNALRRNPQHWLDFMMKFELGLEKPYPMRALQSALTIAISYIGGGLVPLAPYTVIPLAKEAVVASVITTVMALLIFGSVKSYFTGNKPFKSAIQTAFTGAMASAAAYCIAKVFGD